MITKFTELKVWEKAHALTLAIYASTKRFPRTETFGLVSQMRRCAVSIPSNITEGFKKESAKDSVHFYNISEGSLEELKYQTILAHDLEYIDQETFEKLMDLEEEVGKMLYRWKKSQASVSASSLTGLQAY